MKQFFYALIISLLFGFGGHFCYDEYETIQNNKVLYNVEGTIIAKDAELYSHGKHHRNMDTRYVMAINPTDSDKFRNFSIHVDYYDYVTHEVGDKIVFKDMYPSGVLKNYTYPSLWQTIKGELPLLSSIFFYLIAFCMFIYSLGTLYEYIFERDSYDDYDY